MPLIINKTTHEVLDVRDETLYDEADWLILSAAWLEQHGMPAFDRSLWRYENGAIVEGEPPEVVETMAERHLREQREGVTLENGWVMKWTNEDQLKMGLAKARADLLERDGDTSPGIPFFEANGTPHLVGYFEAYEVLLDYSSKVMAEQQRQWTEAANG